MVDMTSQNTYSSVSRRANGVKINLSRLTRRVSGVGKSQLQVRTRKHNSESLTWSSAQSILKTLEGICHILANEVTISKEQLVDRCELGLSLKATFFFLEISEPLMDHDHESCEFCFKLLLNTTMIWGWWCSADTATSYNLTL